MDSWILRGWLVVAVTFAKDLKKVQGKVKDFSNNSDLSKVQEVSAEAQDIAANLAELLAQYARTQSPP